MRCCKNRFKTLRLAAGLLLTLLLTSTAFAESPPFQVLHVETHLQDGVYRLNASIQLTLTAAPAGALENGVPLYFIIRMAVLRERNWWTNHIVAELEQHYRLEYNALSEAYLVVNLNTGVRNAYRHREDALAEIGSLQDFPLLDRVFLEEQFRYLGQIQAELDITRLPFPLLTQAYLSDEWTLASETHQWLLK